MSLMSRLVNPTPAEQKIGIDPFRAALRERIRGCWTDSKIVSVFNLNSSEETEMGNLRYAIMQQSQNADQDTITMDLLDDVLILGENEHYTVAEAVHRLTADEGGQ